MAGARHRRCSSRGGGGANALRDLVPIEHLSGAVFDAPKTSSDFLTPGRFHLFGRRIGIRVRKLRDDQGPVLRVELERFFENLFDGPAHPRSVRQTPQLCTPLRQSRGTPESPEFPGRFSVGTLLKCGESELPDPLRTRVPNFESIEDLSERVRRVWGALRVV